MTNPQSRHAFFSVLPSMVGWYYEDDACTVVYNDAKGTQQSMTITAAALGAIHPALPGAVCAIAGYAKRESLATVTKNALLRAQVRHCVSPVIIKDIGGYTHRLLELRELHCDTTRPFVSISGSAYYLLDQLPATSTKPAVSVTPFVCRVCFANILVQQKDLDHQYPGWQNRFAVASSLDVSGEDLAALVFNNATPMPPVDLTGLSFL